MLSKKYDITQDYIRFGDSRSGQKNYGIKFIVSHDTGNAGSTAYGNRSWFHNSQPLASAHTFIDDKYILEIVPLDEKAWHVMYDKPIDNQMFGDDSNDIAVGVELCWGGKIDFKEAYDRFVWYHAYLCHKYDLEPYKHIVSHKTLDPQRKTDPDNALNRYGITWNQFVNDVYAAYKDFYKEVSIASQPKQKSQGGRKLELNSRKLNEIADLYDLAVERKVFSSKEHAAKARKGELTVDESIYLLHAIVRRVIVEDK